jgi:hypothetical protein
MWKLVRNLVLTGVLGFAGGKLALWAVAQQQAGELAQRVAPWGTLTWSSAGADFDGKLTLGDVRFVPKAALAIAPVEARELELRSHGALSLVTRAITRNTDVPDTLAVHLAGARLPTFEPFGTAGQAAWLGRVSMVPFEALGCGVVTQLSTRDYQAMGLAPALPDLDLEYRYDAAARTLSVSVGAANPGFAAVRAHADLNGFAPAALTDAAARDAARAGQLTINYRDLGYLARRNRFCAQQLGVAPDAFVELHVTAVQEFLKTHRIVPTEDVMALYRRLVAGSGSLELLSLPNANIALSQYATYDPEEVLRWLNLTARHNTSPPVLFKLFFLADEAPADALAGIDPALVHDPLAEPAPSGAATTPPPSATTVAASPPAAAPAPAAAPPAAPPVSPPVSSPAPAPVTTAAVPTKTAPPANAPVFAPKPVVPKPAPSAPVAAAPAATVPTLRVSPPPADPRVAGRTSGPAPAPGSTAALVWQGPGVDTLERPEEKDKPAPTRAFTVVAFDALGAHVGARVVLITSGGKEIAGRIASVDATGVMLSIARDTGQAQFFVDRTRILEIRVQRQNRG